MQHKLTQANKTRYQSNWRSPVKPVVCGLGGRIKQVLDCNSKTICEQTENYVWGGVFGCLCILIFSANTMGHVPILTI